MNLSAKVRSIGTKFVDTTLFIKEPINIVLKTFVINSRLLIKIHGLSTRGLVSGCCFRDFVVVVDLVVKLQRYLLALRP